MYFKSQEIVPWNNLLPFAMEAIDVQDDKDKIQGLNSDVLLISIRAFANKFITDSQILQDRFFIDGQCNVTEYSFYEQGDYTVENIILLTSGNQPLKKYGYLYDGSPVPYGFYNEVPNTIVISNPPNCDVENYISLWCSYRMSLQACGVPQEIFERWGKEIVCGAVAHSFKMALIKGDSTRATTRLINELEMDYGRALKEATAKAKGLLGGGSALQPSDNIEGFLDAGGLTKGGFF